MRWTDAKSVLGVAALVLGATGCHHTSATAGAAGTTVPLASAGTTGATAGSTDALPPPSGPAPAGSCHTRGSGLYTLPDPACTPGATNPAVTQADIGETICSRGWTATIRPPESYTEPLKYEQKAAYGETGRVGSYEEDHLIPLELGGSPTSRRNLWPEAGASPNPKDSVENAANHAVCDGRMTLASAQHAIATNWIALGQTLRVFQAPTSPASASSGRAATCTAHATYDTLYGDWDVYVISNQPDRALEVTAGAVTATWHTDAGGYADVYLHAPRDAGGQNVTVTVGRAACSTIL